jgi:hypothetical protein
MRVSVCDDLDIDVAHQAISIGMEHIPRSGTSPSDYTDIHIHRTPRFEGHSRLNSTRPGGGLRSEFRHSFEVIVESAALYSLVLALLVSI